MDLEEIIEKKKKIFQQIKSFKSLLVYQLEKVFNTRNMLQLKF